ncbi:hypothetical protein [Azospirillum doebereinerae]
MTEAAPFSAHAGPGAITGFRNSTPFQPFAWPERLFSFGEVHVMPLAIPPRSD